MDKTTLTVSIDNPNFIQIPISQPGTYKICINGYLNLDHISSDCEIINFQKAKINGLYDNQKYIVSNNQSYIENSVLSDEQNPKYLEYDEILPSDECEIRVLKVPSISKIPDDFMRNCQNLETLILPDDGSLLEIGNYAFENCINLKSIIIPDSCTTIGIGAFKKCNNAKLIKYNTTTSVGELAFDEKPSEYVCNTIINSATSNQKVLLAENPTIANLNNTTIKTNTPLDIPSMSNDMLSTDNIASAYVLSAITNYLSGLSNEIQIHSYTLHEPENSYTLNYRSTWWFKFEAQNILENFIDSISTFKLSLFNIFSTLDNEIIQKLDGQIEDKNFQKKVSDASKKLNAYQKETNWSDKLLNSLKIALCGYVKDFNHTINFEHPFWSSNSPSELTLLDDEGTTTSSLAEVHSVINSIDGFGSIPDSSSKEYDFIQSHKESSISGLLKTLSSTNDQIYNNGKSILSSGISYFANAFTDAGNAFVKSYKDLDFSDPLTIFNSIEDILDGLGAVIADLISSIVSFVGSALAWVSSLFGDTGKSLAATLKGGAEKLAARIKLFQTQSLPLLTLSNVAAAAAFTPVKLMGQLYGSGKHNYTVDIYKHYALNGSTSSPYECTGKHVYSGEECMTNPIINSCADLVKERDDIQYQIKIAYEKYEELSSSLQQARDQLTKMIADYKNEKEQIDWYTKKLEQPTKQLSDADKKVEKCANEYNTYKPMYESANNSVQYWKKAYEEDHSNANLKSYQNAVTLFNEQRENFKKAIKNLEDAQKKQKDLQLEIDGYNSSIAELKVKMKDNNEDKQNALQNKIDNIYEAFQGFINQYDGDFDKWEKNKEKRLEEVNNELKKRHYDEIHSIKDFKFNTFHRSVEYIYKHGIFELAKMVETYNLENSPTQSMKESLQNVMNMASNISAKSISFDTCEKIIDSQLLSALNSSITQTSAYYHEARCEQPTPKDCKCESVPKKDSQFNDPPDYAKEALSATLKEYDIQYAKSACVSAYFYNQNKK